jgi:hypothetical protein
MTTLIAIETPLQDKIMHLAPLAAAVPDFPDSGYSRFFEKKLSA